MVKMLFISAEIDALYLLVVLSMFFLLPSKRRTSFLEQMNQIYII